MKEFNKSYNKDVFSNNFFDVYWHGDSIKNKNSKSNLNNNNNRNNINKTNLSQDILNNDFKKQNNYLNGIYTTTNNNINGLENNTDNINNNNKYIDYSKNIKPHDKYLKDFYKNKFNLPEDDFNSFSLNNSKNKFNTQINPVLISNNSNPLKLKSNREGLTKDQLNMMLMENRFRKLEENSNEERKKLLRIMNVGLTEPVNQLIHYHNIREEEQADKREIEERRERIKRELEKAQSTLARELEISSEDNEDDDFKTKINRLDRNLKKQLSKYDNKNKIDKPNTNENINAYNTSFKHTNLKDNAFNNNNYNYFKDYLTENERLYYKDPIIKRTERDIKFMREDYEILIGERRVEEKRQFSRVYDNYVQTIKDLNRQINNYEQKNKLDIEYLRIILEDSGSNRLKYLSKMVLGGEKIDESQWNPKTMEEVEDNYEIKSNNDIQRLLDVKDNNKSEFDRALDDDVEKVDIDDWKKNRKNNIREILESRQANKMNNIDKLLEKSNYQNIKLDKLSHLKKYILTSIFLSRIINIKINKMDKYKMEILKVFTSYYESMYKSVENWVFKSIKTVYVNIVTNTNININLNSIGKDGDSKSNIAYIQLETRVKGIFEGLINNTNLNNLDINTLKLFSIIISNNSYVPFKFYSMFELSRFITENSQIKNITKQAQVMILSFYIIIKVLCKICLYDHKFGEKPVIDSLLYNNFKSIISIFYWGTIKTFTTKKYSTNINDDDYVIQKVRDIKDKKTFNDIVENSQITNKQKKYLYNENNFSYNLISDNNYVKKCKEYFERNQKLDSNYEIALLKKILRKIYDIEPDRYSDEFEYFSIISFSKEETENKFFNKAEAKGFYFDGILINWVNKLISILPEINITGEEVEFNETNVHN